MRFILIIFILMLTAIGGCQRSENFFNQQKSNLKHYLIDNTVDQSTQDNMEQPTQDNKVQLALVGDILLASTIEKLMDINGIDYPWVKVTSILTKADAAIGNLETSVGYLGKPQEKQYTFQAKPESLQGLKKAGIDVVTIANNHTLDFGREALLESMKQLNDHGIKYTGAGNNQKEAFTPIIIERKGIKIGVLAASRVIPTPDWRAEKNTPGLATTYDPGPLLDELTKLRPAVDLVVVSVHWGKELASFPEDYQINLGHRLVDAGADVVLGHHPHVLQGIEVYQGKIIAYSMGNFVFTSRGEITRDSSILLVDYQTGRIQAKVVPAYITAGQPSPLDPKTDGRRLIEKLRHLSQPFKTTLSDNGELLAKD